MTSTRSASQGRGGDSPRFVLLALLLLAPSCAGDKCEIPDAPPQGTYEITWSRYRPELYGSVVEINDSTLIVRYTLPDGSRWHATYALEGAIR